MSYGKHVLKWLNRIPKRGRGKMRQLTIGDRVLTDKDCFVIAELGSNHGGDADLCEKMIIEAARCGADAVKLQKRANDAMFTKTALAKPYNNDFSFGKTYGEHREYLDWFGVNEFVQFKATAKRHGVLFFATPFEEESALFLQALNIPLWKIASSDVSNLPLLKFVAHMQQPMLVSIGGHDLTEVRRMTDALDEINPNYALLHCVSLYPNEDKDLGLQNIVWLRDVYADKLIGFSSHHPGIEPLIIARSLGASIFEVHFTLNRGSRGTDHGFSIEPQGLAKICEDLPRVTVMIGDGIREITERERTGFVAKMGKGIYLRKAFRAGHVIKEVDITIKSPYAGGFKPWDEEDVVGRELL